MLRFKEIKPAVAFEKHTKKLLDERIERAFTSLGNSLVLDAKAKMKSRKTGRHYPNLPNRSSARGEGLATQSGATERSISYRIHGSRYMIFGGGTKQLAIWEGNSSNRYNNRPTLLKSVQTLAPSLKGRM